MQFEILNRCGNTRGSNNSEDLENVQCFSQSGFLHQIFIRVIFLYIPWFL